MIDEKKLIEAIAEYMSNVYGCDLEDVVRFQTNNESKSAYIVQGLCEAVEFIEEQPKVGDWIPVSERLPEEGVDVLMCIIYEESEKIVVTARVDYNYWCGLGRDVKGAIAWMPLPEQYKGE